MSIEERINKLETELNELKSELKQKEKSSRWKPNHRDIYYYLNHNSKISDATYYNDAFDAGVMAIGNYFSTKEEAEFEAERLKVLAEMKEFEESPDREWDGENEHFCIYWSFYRNCIGIDYKTESKHNEIYFESKEIAEKCMSKVGADRIKKYYCRVKE